jgi:hypothetical protein
MAQRFFIPHLVYVILRPFHKRGDFEIIACTFIEIAHNIFLFIVFPLENGGLSLSLFDIWDLMTRYSFPF